MNYGGSIGQVASQDFAMDAAQRAAFEQMLTRLVAQRREDKRNAFLDAENRRRYDDQRALQTREFDYRQQRDRAMDADRDAAREDGAHFRQMEILARRQAGEVAAEEAMRRRKEYEDAKDSERWMRVLPEAADRGQFANEDEFKAAVPKTMWDYSSVFVPRSQAVRREYDAADSAAGRDAEVLNQAQRLRNMIAAEKESGSSPRWLPWGGSVRSEMDPTTGRPVSRRYEPNAEWIADWESELGKVSPREAAIQASKDRMGILTGPDDNGMVRSGVVKPWGQTVPSAPAKNQIPEAAIKYLRANPATRAEFDAMFGAGASTQYLR